MIHLPKINKIFNSKLIWPNMIRFTVFFFAGAEAFIESVYCSCKRKRFAAGVKAVGWKQFAC